MRGVLFGSGRTRVDDVKKHFRLHDFFECRSEGPDEGCRQTADEAHGVADQDLTSRREADLAHRGVQRREHFGIGEDACAGEAIEECRLAGVGVAHQCQCCERYGLALTALRGTTAANAIQILFDCLNALMDASAVGFELRFTRTARADTAAEPRHRRAFAGEARQHVN